MDFVEAQNLFNNKTCFIHVICFADLFLLGLEFIGVFEVAKESLERLESDVWLVGYFQTLSEYLFVLGVHGAYIIRVYPFPVPGRCVGDGRC